MILWLNSNLGIKEHQVNVENEKYSLNSQQTKKNTKIQNQIYLTQVNIIANNYNRIYYMKIVYIFSLLQEEILVCYECLKHLSTKMETCSSCYFALLCSENCKKQHKKERCITKMRQHCQIKIQNELNKSDITMKKLIEKKSCSTSISHLASSEKSCKDYV